MRALELLDEAALNPAQLAKRDNWQVFTKKIEDGEPFLLVGDPETEVFLGYEDEEQHEEFLSMLDGEMNDVLAQFKAGASIMFPVIDGEDEYIKLTQLQKSKEFGRRGGKSETERQEKGFVDAINQAVQKNRRKPVNVTTDEEDLKNIIAANKVEGSNELGKEPYADIAVHNNRGSTELISAKNVRAPSIAGGGISGLFNIDPNIVGNAVKKAWRFYKTNFADSEGKKFPQGKAIEVYVKIPETWHEEILKGTKEMGGPIDYMYIGPMDVDAEIEDNTVKLNGNLININDYMGHVGDLFLRIRRRRADQVLDFSSVDKYGFPNIFYSRGEGGRRVVLVSSSSLPKGIKKKGKDMYVGLGE